MQTQAVQRTAAHVGSAHPRWIGAGVEVDPGLTPEELAEAAGADFRVGRFDLQAILNSPNHDLPSIKVPGFKALVRTDTNAVLDIVPKGWEQVQNSEAFAFFDDFAQEGHLTMTAAGVMDGGRKVWAMARLKGGVRLFGKDNVEGYLLFTNPHEYGKAIDIRVVTRQIICDNQIPFLLSQKVMDAVKVTHRTEFDPAKARAAIGSVNEKMEKFGEAAELLSNKQFSEQTVMEYFATLFPKTSGEGKGTEPGRAAHMAMDALDTHPGHEMGRGTWWRALSTVTWLTSNILGKKPETRHESLWYGQYGTVNRKALNLALELAK